MESASGDRQTGSTVRDARDHDPAHGPVDDPKPWITEPSPPRLNLSRKQSERSLIKALRILGILRRKVDQPVAGRKAYPRWWERLRALIVLVGIVSGIGVGLAAVVGVTILGLGFLLEQAIS